MQSWIKTDHVIFTKLYIQLNKKKKLYKIAKISYIAYINRDYINCLDKIYIIYIIK